MATTHSSIDTHLEDDNCEHVTSNPARMHSCPRKRIIVACDGTWMDSDSVDQVPSNITRIIRAIPPVGVDNNDPAHPTAIPQITFYQNGVGTGQSGWYYKQIGKYLQGATGEGLADNIREAYSFICSNYHRDDEIILLGFSRGAFTARSISTLIKQLGLLTPKGLSYLVEMCDDWEHQNVQGWKSSSPEPWPDRPSFSDPAYHEMLHKLQLSRRNIPIKCVAVWDTVGALGIPSLAIFPPSRTKEFAFVDTKALDNVEYAFHALGLDERRRSYAPTIWYKPPEQHFPRVLKQTWFPGVHSDVGGSYANDDIANLTLAWMVGQLEEHKLLTFNRDYLIRQIHQTLFQHEKAQEVEAKTEESSSTPRTIERARTFGPLRPWGTGKIHDSYTLFFRLAGSQTRTPMEHPEYTKATMSPTGHTLTGTHESMHASVRVRMALDAPGPDDKGDYASDALKGWSFIWKADAQPDTPWQVSQPGVVGRVKGVEWVKKKVGREELRMPEDEMTEFERVVLRHWTSREDGWEEGAREREEVLYSARPRGRETGGEGSSGGGGGGGMAKQNVKAARAVYGTRTSRAMSSVVEENHGEQEVNTADGPKHLHITTNM
ncbi:hypothetical protein LTR64_006183 [Lithohypha guttulata]|uniref:uncharacterized protein n=1 Tax=Lithohypha guttulata TaxID=1690604 RepID=UPI002DE00BC4|nr:hypothetical protein LTR51_002019 [Lithohypha guttulata]